MLVTSIFSAFTSNATLTAKFLSWQSVTNVFPGFLTLVLTQLFFPKPSTTFLTCFCRGERRKYALKGFAEDKLKVAQIAKFVLDWVENIVGKGENAGNQHFLLIPQCFHKPSLLGSLNVVELKTF